MDVASESDDNAAGVGAPVRGKETGEGGNKVVPSAVFDCLGGRFDVGGFFDETEVITEPLNEGAGDSDGAFERVVSRTVADLIGDGGEKAALRWDDLGSGVEKHEASGAVRVLGFADLVAGLAVERGLWVAEIAADGHNASYRAAGKRLPVQVGIAGRTDRGKHLTGDTQSLGGVGVPGEALEIQGQGAAGVGHVGHVGAALGSAGELPYEPGVDVAEEGVASLRGVAQAVDVLEKPLELRPGEISAEGEAGLGSEAILSALLRELVTGAAGSWGPPGRGVVVGPAGLFVPDERRLPLGRDPDGGQVVSVNAGPFPGAPPPFL